jgi:hypothetical protein
MISSGSTDLMPWRFTATNTTTLLLLSAPTAPPIFLCACLVPFPFLQPEPSAAEAAAAAAAAGPTDPTKFVGKKSKAVAKKGAGATQWEILAKSGIPEEEIPQFR